MKNIYEEAYRLIYSDLTKWDRPTDSNVELPISELNLDPSAKRDPKISFYVNLSKVNPGLRPDSFIATVIFLHDVSDLNLLKFSSHELAEDKIKFIEQRLKELISKWPHVIFCGDSEKFIEDREEELIEQRLNNHFAYTNNVLNLMFNKKQQALEKVWHARQLHYVISNQGQPWEVTKYRLCRQKPISLD